MEQTDRQALDWFLYAHHYRRCQYNNLSGNRSRFLQISYSQTKHWRETDTVDRQSECLAMFVVWNLGMPWTLYNSAVSKYTVF